MKTIAKPSLPGKPLGLFLSVAISMGLLFTLLVAGDAGRARAQTTGDCSNGIAVPNPSDNPGLVSDCDALLAAGDTFSGTASLNWSASLPISTWDGVELSESPSRVDALELRGYRLTGMIPAELGKLSELRELTLSAYLCDDNGCTLETGSDSNRLTGEIPSELGDLKALIDLNLEGNQLRGEIPSELGNLTSLENLLLTDNRLTGGIPSDLGNLTNLEWLSFYSNDLSGEIPSELGGLSNLSVLALGGNQLSGEIPSELGGLSNLSVLALGFG